MYSLEELEMIAELAKKWDVLVIADEVYEWMIYKGHKHIKIGKRFSPHTLNSFFAAK